MRDTFHRRVTLATGRLTGSTIRKLIQRLCEAFPGLEAQAVPIRNDFFGETITVSGLITGQDLIAQLKEKRNNGTDLGDTLLIPSNMLRSGEEVFLDDLTISDVERELEIRVKPIDTPGSDFVRAVLDPDYQMERDNSGQNFNYIRAYPDRKTEQDERGGN